MYKYLQHNISTSPPLPPPRYKSYLLTQIISWKGFCLISDAQANYMFEWWENVPAIPVARGFGLQWSISLIWWGREVILSLVSSTSADSAAVDATKWNPRLIHPVPKPAGKTKRCNNYRLNHSRVVEFIVQWFAWTPWHLGSPQIWFLQ